MPAIAADREIVWTTDLNLGGASLLISLFVDHGQPVHYIPGRIVHHAAAPYRGEGGNRGEGGEPG